jgi:hypothetical protein
MSRIVRVLLAAGIAATSLAAAGSTFGSGPAASGLRGFVSLSPIRPVCVEGEPCSKPAAHVALAFRREGRVAARVETGAAGWYSVRLAPGRYSVTAPRFTRGAGVTPDVIRVHRGRIARVDLEIDTGLQ